VLRIPELSTALALDELTVADPAPDPTFVLLEEQAVGVHTLELWGPCATPRTWPPATATPPRGELIGTCIRCGVGVGDKEWIFGGWDGENWRFSGHGSLGHGGSLRSGRFSAPAARFG
jgi:hypothetical protein